MKINDSQYLKRALKFFFFVLIILVITTILSTIFMPTKEELKSIGDTLPKRLDQAKGLNLVGQYIIHNGFAVPLQMFILALIPIPFLYSINLLSTTIPLGILLGFAINLNIKVGIAMILSTIPHASFELFAFCLVASGLYQVNKSMTRKLTNIFRKQKKENISFKEAFINFIKIFICRALPLFIIAAFLEAYLATDLYRFFKNLI